VTADHHRHVDAAEHRHQELFGRLPRERLGVTPRRRVNEHHVAEPRNLELDAHRPRGDQMPLLGAELIASPLHDLAKGWGHTRRNAPGQLREHLSLAVPLNELHRDLGGQQVLERLARHRPEDGITADDDQIDRGGVHVLQDGLERGKVTVNVVESRYPHGSRAGCSISV
jgi:hypothetical protein